jgi:hypothetical protein
VSAAHVERAADLLALLDNLKDIAVRTTDAAVDAVGISMNAHETKRQEMASYLLGGGSAFEGLWSQQHFALNTGCDKTGLDLDDSNSEGEAGEHTDSPVASPLAITEPLADSIAEGAVSSSSLAILNAADVKTLKYGYGVDGASVQTTCHHPDLTDRVIMQKTLLCGCPIIKDKQICDKLKSQKSAGRKALPRPVWAKVMTSGLKDCPIAAFRSNQVVMTAIPTDAHGRVKYHNELMKLCALPLRDLVEAMKASKQKRSSGEGAAATAAKRKKESTEAQEAAEPEDNA